MDINLIHNIDCSEGLKTIPDDSVDCCVTSPPYYGLRDYGTATWIGGNSDCDHLIGRQARSGVSGKQKTNSGSFGDETVKNGCCCPKCGALREDKQIGLEDTPEAYIKRLAEVFTEVHRVLKPTGTLWLNIGDSYNGSGKADGCDLSNYLQKSNKHAQQTKPTRVKGLKPKDLIGIPWSLAFELRKRGWWLRQDIIWHKPIPSPEAERPCLPPPNADAKHTDSR